MGKDASLLDVRLAAKGRAGEASAPVPEAGVAVMVVPPVVPPASAPADPVRGGRAEVKVLTMRMSPAAYEQLRRLSFSLHKPQSVLLLEGLNLIFDRHGLPPIAI